ncbi:MAG: triose-phosphate isomerase [Bacteroidales bacterium]|nr:triose-phosphate isomerase [Bacteroidales bacterium]
MRKKIVAGNWKMNTTVPEGVELAKAVVELSGKADESVQLIVAAPFTHLCPLAEVLKGTRVALSAENCADKEKGAYTGEVSAAMLASAGCGYTILGHSERRQYYGETDAKLVEKTRLALANGLKVILCVGENLEEREAGKHFDVVEAQIKNVLFNFSAEELKEIVIAYEPVWAIGTGKTATAEQAQEIHAFIRKTVAAKFGAQAAEDTSILYGGSCKPSNAAELFACPDIDGGLIGGAALKAEDFIAIACSY